MHLHAWCSVDYLLCVSRVTICFKTFVFKIWQKMPNLAGFMAKELPDNDNYPIIINYKFWSSLMSYANFDQWKLYTNICSFIISREKSQKIYKIGLIYIRLNSYWKFVKARYMWHPWTKRNTFCFKQDCWNDVYGPAFTFFKICHLK